MSTKKLTREELHLLKQVRVTLNNLPPQKTRNDMVKVECYNCHSIYRCSRTTMEIAPTPFKNQTCVFCSKNGWLEYDSKFRQKHLAERLSIIEKQLLNYYKEKSELGENIREALKRVTLEELVIKHITNGVDNV